MSNKMYTISLTAGNFPIDNDLANQLKVDLAANPAPTLMTFDELKVKGIDLSTLKFSVSQVVTQDNVSPGQTVFQGQVSLVGMIPTN